MKTFLSPEAFSFFTQWLTMSNMSETNYVTQEGLEKLHKELRTLKTKERAEIARQIAEARDKGDLSENAEYDAAKEAQAHLELKIAKLTEAIANTKVITSEDLDASKVLVLSTVKIKNLDNGATMSYTLVSENEADLAQKKISVKSPIAKGLLGKSVGEIAEIQTPSGIAKFEIISISR